MDAKTCVCPNGKQMMFQGDHFKGTRGNYMRFRGKLTDCRSCPMQSTCMKNPINEQGRQVSFYADYIETDSCLELMKKRIDSEQGRREYGRRMWTIEPVFGNITSNKRLSRISVRGKAKATAQWLMYCMIHNLEKLNSEENNMRVGFLHSLIRKDEKLLIEEFNKHNEIELVMIDDRKLSFNLANNKFDFEVVIERSINHSRALHALRLFESAGIKCVNSFHVASICGDKLLTSAALQDNQVPQPEVRVAFTEKSALDTINDMGYPVVLKPAVGSWGRLLSKINDKDAAESILEHKTVLGSYHHSIFIKNLLKKFGASPKMIAEGIERYNQLDKK